MTDITRSSGDTKRIVVRLTQKSVAVSLAGYTNFEMIVAATEDAAADERLMVVAGVVIDEDGGLVAFTPLGTVPVGSHFYNCRANDNNSERVTFKKGRYIVTKAME